MNRLPQFPLVLTLGLMACASPILKAEEVPTMDVAGMNALLGIELWKDDRLWDDTDSEVARRLGWPQESRTDVEASFRYYPGINHDGMSSYRILETRAYTAALYAAEGKPLQLSIMFSNKGDFPLFRYKENPSKSDIDAFKSALESEADALSAKLTAALGPATRAKMGTGKELRERLDRWNWHDHAILLSYQEEEYISLRILPVELADNKGRTGKVSDSEIKQTMLARVTRRDNGDVIISQIPMADQGPKGYCVPATWERYLRYLGIPADMYVLARAGSSGYGGGTYLNKISEVVDDIARSNKRTFKHAKSDLEPRKIANYIDEGLPLMWAVFGADSEFYQRDLTRRASERSRVTDWTDWRKQLDRHRSAAKGMRFGREGAHVCMIIGYNEDTGEIATSDSWGKSFVERWMTVEEAEAISQGKLQFIRW